MQAGSAMTHLRAYRGVSPRLGARAYVDPAATLIGDVELGDDVSIWPGAVLRGDVEKIRVGAGALVAPGKVIGEGELWIGNPARCVRKLGKTEIDALAYSARHYVRLKDEY